MPSGHARHRALQSAARPTSSERLLTNAAHRSGSGHPAVGQAARYRPGNDDDVAVLLRNGAQRRRAAARLGRSDDSQENELTTDTERRQTGRFLWVGARDGPDVGIIERAHGLVGITHTERAPMCSVAGRSCRGPRHLWESPRRSCRSTRDGVGRLAECSRPRIRASPFERPEDRIESRHRSVERSGTRSELELGEPVPEPGRRREHQVERPGARSQCRSDRRHTSGKHICVRAGGDQDRAVGSAVRHQGREKDPRRRPARTKQESPRNTDPRGGQQEVAVAPFSSWPHGEPDDVREQRRQACSARESRGDEDIAAWSFIDPGDT
jgi:hypothetical protein